MRHLPSHTLLSGLLLGVAAGGVSCASSTPPPCRCARPHVRPGAGSRGWPTARGAHQVTPPACGSRATPARGAARRATSVPRVTKGVPILHWDVKCAWKDSARRPFVRRWKPRLTRPAQRLGTFRKKFDFLEEEIPLLRKAPATLGAMSAVSVDLRKRLWPIFKRIWKCNPNLVSSELHKVRGKTPELVAIREAFRAFAWLHLGRPRLALRAISAAQRAARKSRNKSVRRFVRMDLIYIWARLQPWKIRSPIDELRKALAQTGAKHLIGSVLRLARELAVAGDHHQAIWLLQALEDRKSTPSAVKHQVRMLATRYALSTFDLSRQTFARLNRLHRYRSRLVRASTLQNPSLTKHQPLLRLLSHFARRYGAMARRTGNRRLTFAAWQLTTNWLDLTESSWYLAERPRPGDQAAALRYSKSALDIARMMYLRTGSLKKLHRLVDQRQSKPPRWFKPPPRRLVFGGARIVSGGATVDAKLLRDIMRSHYSAFGNCYVRRVPLTTTQRRGTVNLAFELSKDGRSRQGTITQDTVGSAPLRSCLLGVLGRIRFPAHDGKTQLLVTYSLRFGSAMRRKRD